MAVGHWKVANGLAADEIVNQRASLHNGNWLSLYTIVIDVVAAHQALALEILERGIVDHRQEIG